jgi:6-pyruvoyltetrahydropterin/6-carboxytetrahydropterin synthase
LAQVEITRRIEFDAGHRIPDHASKCRNIHGHRYVLEATVRGDVQSQRGRSDDGMVVDFGDLKTMMNVEIGDKWDHAFLVSMSDGEAIKASACMGDAHKTVYLDCVPTVENLARIAFHAIDERIRTTDVGPPNFQLHHVRLYETPNCWADVYQPRERT